MRFTCSWNACVVDGHDVESLCRHFYEAEQVKEKPTVLICKTFKGKGIPGKQFYVNWSYTFLFELVIHLSLSMGLTP